MFEHPVSQSLHLCFGYVVLVPALLFLWDTEKFSTPEIWCSAAEDRKGKGKKTSALFENQKQMFWGFGRSNWRAVSRVLCFEEVKRRQP